MRSPLVNVFCSYPGNHALASFLRSVISTSSLPCCAARTVPPQARRDKWSSHAWLCHGVRGSTEGNRSDQSVTVARLMLESLVERPPGIFHRPIGRYSTPCPRDSACSSLRCRGLNDPSEMALEAVAIFRCNETVVLQATDDDARSDADLLGEGGDVGFAEVTPFLDEVG